MFDCANVEMREVLPDLVAGTLDARTRAQVEEHVAGCAECASELETVKLVRAAYGAAPAIDTHRVVAALAKPIATSTPAASKRAPAARWMDWRIAAALTMITVGGLSIALNRQSTPDVVRSIDTALANDLAKAGAESVTALASGAVQRRTTDTTNPKASPTPLPQPVRNDRVQLSFGGGVSDLDEASLKALLGALDEIDRAPVALSAEPDHAPVLPAGREGTR